MKDLAAVSLNKPVRVFVNENTDVALGLRQEFIRVRANREGDREAIVAGRYFYLFACICCCLLTFSKKFSRTLSKCQTGLIQSVMIWFQTVCKGYQQMTKITLARNKSCRGCYMNAHVFLNLLNELRKRY